MLQMTDDEIFQSSPFRVIAGKTNYDNVSPVYVSDGYTSYLRRRGY